MGGLGDFVRDLASEAADVFISVSTTGSGKPIDAAKTVGVPSGDGGDVAGAALLAAVEAGAAIFASQETAKAGREAVRTAKKQAGLIIEAQKERRFAQRKAARVLASLQIARGGAAGFQANTGSPVLAALRTTRESEFSIRSGNAAAARAASEIIRQGKATGSALKTASLIAGISAGASLALSGVQLQKARGK